jgi:tetrahydromethanopterin S-methyltransferase subunit D
MKKLIVPATSIAVNIIFLGYWIHSYNSYNTHQGRIDAFSKSIPEGISIGLLAILLVSLIVISFVFILNVPIKKWVQRVFVFVQSLFLSLLTWQLL